MEAIFMDDEPSEEAEHTFLSSTGLRGELVIITGDCELDKAERKPLQDKITALERRYKNSEDPTAEDIAYCMERAKEYATHTRASLDFIYVSESSLFKSEEWIRCLKNKNFLEEKLFEKVQGPIEEEVFEKVQQALEEYKALFKNGRQKAKTEIASAVEDLEDKLAKSIPFIDIEKHLKRFVRVVDKVESDYRHKLSPPLHPFPLL